MEKKNSQTNLNVQHSPRSNTSLSSKVLKYKHREEEHDNRLKSVFGVDAKSSNEILKNSVFEENSVKSNGINTNRSRQSLSIHVVNLLNKGSPKSTTDAKMLPHENQASITVEINGAENLESV